MSQNDLQSAYNLIRDGRLKDAREVLLPLCKAQPDSLDAWWLLSFALEEPAHIRDALEHVLRLDPQHSKAQERLANLNEGRPRKSGPGSVMLRLALIGIVGVIVAASVIALFLLGADDAPQDDVVVNELPTLNSLADAEAALTKVAAARNDVASPTPFQRGTLPPTWTPSPTHTASPLPTITLTELPPILPTRTIPFDPNTLPTLEPLPTRDPSGSQNNNQESQPTQVASAPQGNNPEPLPASGNISQEFLDSTYWLGDGERGMEEMQIDGNYRRHYYLPVKIWIDPSSDPGWLAVIDEAVGVVSAVVPLQFVDTEEEANIPIYLIVDDNVYETYCTVNSTGCAHIDIDLDKAGEFLFVDSWVRVRNSAEPSATLIAHELIHALGVIVHSPNREDVMYPRYTADGTLQLSTRDQLVLEFLYTLPALGADSARPE